MFTHRHADGGFYRFVCSANGKGDEPGVDWMPGVIYEGADGEKRWTTQARWDDRFEELPPSRFQETTKIDTLDDHGEIVGHYIISIEEVGEARAMLIRAATKAHSDREFHIATLLKCQAEMLSKGLHLRDLDFPDLLGDVNAFHIKFRQIDDDVYGTPRILPKDLFDFRVKFHDEETTEYQDEQSKLLDALRRSDSRDIVNSLELQLDALADAVWVLLGTADLQFGKRIFYEAWKRVVVANMAKVLATEDAGAQDSGRDAKFDVRKPKGWIAPDHRDLVQGYLTEIGLEEK